MTRLRGHVDPALKPKSLVMDAVSPLPAPTRADARRAFAMRRCSIPLEAPSPSAASQEALGPWRELESRSRSRHLANQQYVDHVMFKVLPRLPVGLVVQIHDGFMPPKCLSKWVRDLTEWPGELSSVHPFSLYYAAGCVRWAGQFMLPIHAD